MRASVLMPLLALFSAHAVCQAGVDYYSGSDTSGDGAAVVVSFSSGGASWSPVPSETRVGVKRVTNDSNGTIQLDGQQAVGSLTPYDVYMSANSSTLGFGDLLGYTGAAPSENGIGVTITTASTNNYGYASGTPSSALGNRVVDLYEPSGSGLVANYDGSKSNYFAWHATSASNTLFAIGWARYTVQGTTSLTIEEWAYNLASNTSSIVFGETGVSSGGGDNGGGTVPEPTGLAIFGLASLGFALRRRR
ncbi:MAG: PEP-CTERM sorting domain-containing protein [Rubripirellula sp.]